ncbi:MAG: 50S ribosomal protein L35 [Rhodospirillaceae bacterium]|nr:50S ribosomal protein L35 [Rhodospirillaceae bacterium]
MPKMKSKSAAKKRIWFTGSGKPKRAHAGKRHNLTKRTKAMKRTNRGTKLVTDADVKLVKRYLLPGRA